MSNILVVYWSGTGNTEIMAQKIQDGISQAGKTALVKLVSEVDPSEVSAFDKIAFGCPSMGVEVLEEDEFEPFFAAVEGGLSGKKVALFGSYGWGEGQWMETWQERVLESGADLFKNKGLIVNSTPSSADEDACLEFGKEFANF